LRATISQDENWAAQWSGLEGSKLDALALPQLDAATLVTQAKTINLSSTTRLQSSGGGFFAQAS
jgi:hypothetical protein